jgi:hypothetical protein
MRSDWDRLTDILTAIAKIKELLADSLAFQNDEMLQVWPPAASPNRSGDRHPEVQWPHQIWMMTQKDLLKLEEQVRHIHAEIAADPRSSV